MLYVYLGIGAVRLDRAATRLAAGENSGSLDLVVGLALVLAAGAWVWVFLGVRWSPVGPALLGLALAGLGVLAVAGPDQLARLLPDSLLGFSGVRSAPPAALLLVALPLAGTVLSRRRWRGPRGDQRFSDHPIDAPL